jgi:hypothetical protein
MNILYLVGGLILLFLLGYPYCLLVNANHEKGATKIMGQALAGLFTLVMVLIIIFYQTGLAKMPGFQFRPNKPPMRMMRGMSGYVTGMMLEDEKAIDEFINTLKADPELYKKLKSKLQ